MPAGACAALRPDRAAGALRGRARARLAFPFRRYQMQRVYRGERAAARPLPRVLPVRHRRRRQGHAVDPLRRRDPGGDPRGVRRDWRSASSPSSSTTASCCAASSRASASRGEAQAGVLREARQARQARRGRGARRRWRARVSALAAEAVDRLLAFSRVRSTGHDDALAKLDALGDGNDAVRRRPRRTARSAAAAARDGRAGIALCDRTSRSRADSTTTPALVYETTLDAHPQIGSICSGGRYDDLASHYTKSKLPGVGISIGLTRLFWQLREAGLIGTADSTVEALVALMDDAGLDHALALSQQLRAAGINTEDAARAAQARQAVPVRRPRRHPLRRDPRRRRSRAKAWSRSRTCAAASSSRWPMPILRARCGSSVEQSRSAGRSLSFQPSAWAEGPFTSA